MGSRAGWTEKISRSRVRECVDRLLRSAVRMFFSACMECGACNCVCPTLSVTGDPRSSPLFRVRLARMLVEERIDREAAAKHLFTCLLCGACSSACPFGLDTFRVIYLARCKLALEGYGPPEFNDMAEGAVRSLHSFGLPPEDAYAWMREAGVAREEREARILYVPSPVETAFLPSHAVETARLLEKLGVSWTASTRALDCGGNVGVDASRPDAGLAILLNLVETAESLGVEEIALGACGSDYKWIALAREIIQELGVETPVTRFTSIYTVIARSSGSRRLGSESNRIVLHDPCSMTRYIRVDDDYTRLVPGALTPRFSGPYTVCCGGGGGMSLRRDAEARRLLLKVSVHRLKQLSSLGDTVVTPCIKCYIAFRMGVLRLGRRVRLEGLSTRLYKNLRGEERNDGRG